MMFLALMRVSMKQMCTYSHFVGHIIIQRKNIFLRSIPSIILNDYEISDCICDTAKYWTFILLEPVCEWANSSHQQQPRIAFVSIDAKHISRV